MNTKIIMTSSAFMLGAAGLVLTFLPVETLRFFNTEPVVFSLLAVRLLGALYFSFAMLNWMTRESIIGGIYNRPVAVANFTHFFIAGVALIRQVMSDSGLPNALYAAVIIYSVFAALFGIMLFRRPAGEKKP